LISGQGISFVPVSTPAQTASAPSAVLDTNACLDWLVFKNPAMGALSLALEQAELRWLACARMRDELKHMLGHPSLARWSPDLPAALQTFDRLATLVNEPSLGASQILRCSDNDDQVFIDLAIAQRAQWLVTHDRALLKLARKAGARGVLILPPAQWRPLCAA
jgi:uncharacterized protein